jgi:CelD/BcsL family acetyltransferase involved in cellulose biosynthesis
MQIIGSFRDFAGIQDSCDTLADGLGNPFLGFDWIASCLETLHGGAELHIGVWRRGSEVTAIAPLVSVHEHGHDRLEVAGSSVLLEPCGLLYRDDSALDEMARDLIALGKPLLLRGLDADGPVERALRGALTHTGTGLVMLRGARSSHVIPSRENFLDFVGGLSSKMRQDVRRLRLRAESLGTTRVHIDSPSPRDLPSLLDTLVAVERSGWKGNEPTSLARHDGLRRFFTVLAGRAAARGALRVALLRVGPKVAAVQLSIEAYRRLWVLKMAFDDSMAWCSPGFLLMHESVRDAHERRLEAVELLGSAEAWQERWRPASRPFRSLVVYPYTMRGLSGLAMDAIGHSARQVRDSMIGVRADRG